MAVMLRILQLEIETTTGWQEPYDLDAPVVAIVGPVDSGKSSMLDSITYALGGEIDLFRGVVNNHLRAVRIRIWIGSRIVTLYRSRAASSHVEVTDGTDRLEGRFLVKGKDGELTLSDWMLDQLGLTNLFNAIRLPRGKRLEFATALLPYCYLNQNSIDQHIIRPKRDDDIRIMVLKLLFGLTTPAYEHECSIIRDIDNEIERNRRNSDVISKFLAGSTATAPEAVKATMARLKDREKRAGQRLTRLKDAARATTSFADHQRRQELDAKATKGDAEEALQVVLAKQRRAKSRVDEITEALAKLTELERSEPEPQLPLVPTHSHCPSCKGEINRVAQPGICHLCCQEIPGFRYAAERVRLQAQYQEARDELSACSDAVKRAHDIATAAHKKLVDLLHKRDEQNLSSVTPFLDSIESATGELAAIQQQLADLTEFDESLNRLRHQYDEIAKMEADQAERRRNLHLTGVSSDHPGKVLEALNAMFGAIVAGMDLPNATGHARIDADTLLPIVDEQQFEGRGGGARSAVAVAYSLALVNYALANEVALLPGLLMIDSPQKNFGANDDDQKLAHRVYERFLETRAGSDAPFQLIIVDNHISPDISDKIKIHEFNRDDGFIKNVPNLFVNRDDPDTGQLTMRDI